MPPTTRYPAGLINVQKASQKSSDGQYYETVVAENDLKEEITRLAMEAYGSDIIQSQPPPGPEPPGDDDIPF